MSSKHVFRGEIQGLRAVAVGLVLLFHIWPGVVPGGYVGVDVFFVISGYLIVGSLAREAERTGRVSLLDFYSRRIRRLLPAATLVLACVFGAMFIWLPPARWEDTLSQIAASALYVENWYLAWEAIDYLAAENAASPVQHYWSLSIEEQFYIVWPMVVIAALWIGKRSGLSVRSLVLGALVVTFLSSLTASIILSGSDPARAYFVTHTRAWELALGGLLAVGIPGITANNGLRALLSVTGLAAIIVSGLTFGNVVFPGYLALIPTLGAALVIVAGDCRIGSFRGLNISPMRYVGDISYSLYLWHWPLIVFYLSSATSIGLFDGIILIGVTLALSHFSYHLVEERFRHPDRSIELRPIPLGITSIIALVGAVVASQQSLASITPNNGSLFSTNSAYPGPAALLDNAPVPGGVPLRPPPASLGRDRSPVYTNGCHQNKRNSEVRTCEFGDLNGEISIAVVGSSHSVNWLPALDILGQKNGWKITSITKSACGFHSDNSSSCTEWHGNVVKYLSNETVDLVFVSEHAGKDISLSSAELVAHRWKKINKLNIPILTIRPIPHLQNRPGDCLPDQIEDCVVSRASAERANVIAVAAEQVSGVHVIDMTDAICAKNTCGPVVGNLVVYRDTHHLTATYSAALAPYLERAIAKTYPDLLPISSGAYPKPSAGRGNDASFVCGPSNTSSEGFSRNYQIEVNGNDLSLRRGDWENRVKGFEIWEGKIDRNVVEITGSYRKGKGRIKKLHLSGTANDRSIVAAGNRGPRTCSIIWHVAQGHP